MSEKKEEVGGGKESERENGKMGETLGEIDDKSSRMSSQPQIRASESLEGKRQDVSNFNTSACLQDILFEMTFPLHSRPGNRQRFIFF